MPRSAMPRSAVSRSALPRIAAAVLTAGAVLAAVAPASATPDFAAVQRVDRVTPKCRDYPENPIKGRVSGFIGYQPSRAWTWVGCFPDYGSCEAWSLFATGHFTDRTILRTCEPRRY